MSKRVVNPEVSQAAAALGSKGGSSGTGAKKRRDPLHYSHVLPEKRRIAKLKRQLK